MFVVGLGIGIAVGLPLIGCAALVGGARFNRGISAFVRLRSRSAAGQRADQAVSR